VEQETIREFIELSFEGRIGLFILILLVTMSVASITVTVERFLAFRTARRRSRAFERHVGMPMRGMNMDEAISIGLRHNGPRASVIVSGLIAFKQARLVLPHVNALEEARRASEVAAAIFRGKMKRRLHWLANIASTALLLGFLVTVQEILFGFKGCGCSLEDLRASLFNQYSHALVPTGMGFLISVTTLWPYRYLSSRLDFFQLEMECARAELLNYLQLTSMESAGS